VKDLLVSALLTAAAMFTVNTLYGAQLRAGDDPPQMDRASFLRCGAEVVRSDVTPLAFTKNVGQWDERVRFRANAQGAAMWFTSDGIFYQFSRRIPNNDSSRCRMSRSWSDTRYEIDSIDVISIEVAFVGAKRISEIVGEGAMDFKCNYFVGYDPAGWYSDIPNYRSVRIEELYGGIDLMYYGNHERMEYDFIVSPGADPSQIRVCYRGIDAISVDQDGQLIVETEWSRVTERCPLVYQEKSGGRIAIEGRYAVYDDSTFGFTLDGDYDRSLALVIDPVVTYSTYIGGGGSDYGYGIAVDDEGSAYVTGFTFSSNYPTVNPYQTDQAHYDVIITKVSPEGNSLVYSTYLGGGDLEIGYDIAVDDAGSAYVTGYTKSTDFPTMNPYQTDQLFEDVFVTKLSAAGNSLEYSTYLGGDGTEYGNGIDVDSSGSAYVTGTTLSTEFPLVNAYQSDFVGGEAFVTKLTSTGDGLAYSTYLGGDQDEIGRGIAVDASGSAYVTGLTYSTDFPTVNPYQTDQGSYDAFVSKFSSSGTNLIYSTYIGGNTSDDEGHAIAVDASGNAYITGVTYSSDFPTVNPYQTDQGEVDAFLCKLSAPGSSLLYSTYLGGDYVEDVSGIVVDETGAATVAGWTGSSDFPILNPYQGSLQGGLFDGYVTKLSSSGDSLLFSTILGGGSEDYIYGIDIDSVGALYVAGMTESDSFPTINEYQPNQPFQDVFVVKLGVGDYMCGDVNLSGFVDIDDVIYLVTYIFGAGAPPDPFYIGNANCQEIVDIDDIIYLITYIFGGGSLPCDPDGDGIPDC
jgi:hypothetical protein